MLCGIGPHEWLSEITLQQREQQGKLLDIYIYIYICLVQYESVAYPQLLMN